MPIDQYDESESADPDIDELDATDATAMHLRDLSPDDAADRRVQDDADARAWLKASLDVVLARFERTDGSGRVQLAMDLLVIAACERASRILRSDLAADRG